MPQLAAPRLFASAAAAAAMLPCNQNTALSLPLNNFRAKWVLYLVVMHKRYTQLQTDAISVHRLGCSQCWLSGMLISVSRHYGTHEQSMHFKRFSAHLHVIAIGGIKRGGSACASLGQLCSANKLQQAETLSICHAKLLPVLALQHMQLRVSAFVTGPSKAVCEQTAVLHLANY
jgi:hypothetical protein